MAFRPGRSFQWKRFAEFWENLYSWWLLWTYNPASRQGKTLRDLERCQLWMARSVFAARYGSAVPDPAKRGAIH